MALCVATDIYLLIVESVCSVQNGYDAMQAQALAGVYQPEWQDYQYSEQLAYPEQYLQQNYDMQADAGVLQDPRFMSQEEKDRGLGSVFKRDDQRLQQLRERDAREKDPNFISESYSECYPGYQEYNREIVDSDDEADLSKMDMGGRVSDVLFLLKIKSINFARHSLVYPFRHLLNLHYVLKILISVKGKNLLPHKPENCWRFLVVSA